MSSLVEVSPDSSVCTSSTVTPCMTPDSPVDHLFKQAYLPVEMQRQVRSVRLMKMETTTGDGGLEIDDESAEEYSFDLEAEEEEGEEMRDIEKDGSLRNLDAVRNDQEKEKMRSSVNFVCFHQHSGLFFFSLSEGFCSFRLQIPILCIEIFAL